MIAKIKIVNYLTNEVVKDETVNKPFTLNEMGDWADRASVKFGDLYPDCGVTISYQDGKSFIATQPKNMRIDEAMYYDGEMTWDEYSNKWYKFDESMCVEYPVEIEEESIDPWELDKADPSCD
jgi:hypothetical protein